MSIEKPIPPPPTHSPPPSPSSIFIQSSSSSYSRLRCKKAPFSYAPPKRQFDPEVHFGPEASSKRNQSPVSSLSADISPKHLASASFEDSFGIKRFMNTG